MRPATHRARTHAPCFARSRNAALIAASALSLTSLASLSACGNAEPFSPRSLLPTGTAGRSLVFVDSTSHTATLLDADKLNADPMRIVLPPKPQPLVTRPGSEGETLVLCRGEGDDSETTADAPALVVLNATGEARRYPLGSSFNAMTVSDDGKYAMLFFDGTATTGSLIFNPNEIAIVDLSRDATDDDNPRSRTLRSFGHAPTRIEFSPAIQIGGTERRLAVVLFDTVVLLVDLDHLDRPEYTIELATSTTRSIDLTQVVFDAERGRLYVRGTASTDVYVITLNDIAAEAGENDFVPSLNQLGIGAVPIDMALYTAGDEPRLLTITAGARAVIVDTDTSRTTSITLPVAATSIAVFTATSPFDPVQEQRALLYAEGTARVMFLDLREVEERGARNLESLTIQSVYTRFTPLADNLVLLPHQTNGLSVLDLEQRTASPIRSSLNLGSALPDPGADKLWVAPSGQSQLAFLDLRDFHPGAIDLRRPIREVVIVPSDTDTGPSLAIVHASSVGHVTVINSDDPTDLDSASAARGFLFHDILNDEEQNR